MTKLSISEMSEIKASGYCSLLLEAASEAMLDLELGDFLKIIAVYNKYCNNN